LATSFRRKLQLAKEIEGAAKDAKRKAEGEAKKAGEKEK